MNMKVFNPQWNRDMDVSDQLATYMEKAGYEPWHTGGGCMAWRKDEDKDGNAYTMITYIDVELGQWKDRNDPQWIVGRYVWDDCDDGWICCEDGLPLARAVEVGGLLPKPKADVQAMISAKALEVARNFTGANLYQVIVHVKGNADYMVELKADREGLAQTRVMVLYPYPLNGALVTYTVTKL